MPYIDSTPKDYPLKFEEDNLQDVFGQMLVENGWIKERTFYKAVVDTRAYHKLTDRVNYAIAKHTIFKNADGKLLGFATTGYFNIQYRLEHRDTIRRPGDDTDPEDKNFGLSPSWDVWVKQRFAATNVKTKLYFYQLEKLPNASLAPEGEVVSMVTMPGMGGTQFEIDRDKDRKNWAGWYYYGDEVFDFGSEVEDLIYDGKILSASPFHVLRSALDIEVYETEWDEKSKEVLIIKTDPRVMQSPIVNTTLRAEFLEHVDNPLWHTNWWTDSEVRVRGHVDSRTIFLVLQADNAPAWEKNLVPTIPLYFGKVNSLDGDDDEGYALFSGTIPPARRIDSTKAESTYLKNSASPSATKILVMDGSKLPDAPSLVTISGKEIIKIVAKEGNLLTVEREQEGTQAKNPYWGVGATVARLSTNNQDIPNETVIALYDFDDPGATVGEVMQPLLKLYPHHPSNGVDSVMVSKSRFGARYQAHYLSWNVPPNQMPPSRMTDDGRKYPRAYEDMQNTNNYKYPFNPSRYSDKVHSSRIFLVHPEEGVRGYLDKAIGFNTQSLNASNLRVRKQDCPEKIYEMYKYISLGAVSPLTKVPATPFRPVGLGIYSEDFNPNALPYDPTTDTTPAGEVTITKTVSPQTQTVDIEFTLPEDADLKHVNIYIDDVLYAKGITRTHKYRIIGLTTGFTPVIRLTTVDLAGNESAGVTAPTVTIA